MDRKTRDRRKFFLREAGGFAQRPQSRRERARSASAHRRILCESHGVRVSYGSCVWRTVSTFFRLESIAAANCPARETAALVLQGFGLRVERNKDNEKNVDYSRTSWLVWISRHSGARPAREIRWR